jgi:lipoate-protein ligase A
MDACWRLILSPPERGAWNMAADEAILDAVGRGESPPTLRLYAWSPPCLSLGRSQPSDDVDFPRLRAFGWDAVRRLTGGRAVLHADELTYAVFFPANHPLARGGVLDTYRRLAKGLLAALRDLGVLAEMSGAADSRALATKAVCFETPSDYEIVANGKKLLGSAQARQRNAVLQHGSLPLYGDLTRVIQALRFEGESERRDAALRLRAHAATLEDVLGRRIPWKTAANAFVRGFTREMGFCFDNGTLSPAESREASRLRKEKYALVSWTERI